ncbi:MAG: transporter associated domain-containing protein, partial [Syntrophobacteraceae bacterium]
VEKLEDFLQVDLPEGDFESVGGFIISLIGKVPEVNEKVIYGSLEIVIEAGSSRKIDRVRIRKLGPGEIPEEPSV